MFAFRRQSKVQIPLEPTLFSLLSRFFLGTSVLRVLWSRLALVLHYTTFMKDFCFSYELIIIFCKCRLLWNIWTHWKTTNQVKLTFNHKHKNSRKNTRFLVPGIVCRRCSLTYPIIVFSHLSWLFCQINYEGPAPSFWIPFSVSWFYSA